MRPFFALEQTNLIQYPVHGRLHERRSSCREPNHIILRQGGL